MSSLRKWLTLSPGERGLLIQAWLLLAAIRVALWLLPFRVVHQWLSRVQASASRFPIERIGWAVAVASVYIPFATCLPQALTALALLRRHGHAADLKIGVARDANGRLEAHAWVESAGQIVIGGSASAVARYTPLPAVPLERHHAN